MPTTRIFLSHSSRGADNDAIVDGLHRGLVGEGFQVYLDRSGDIQPGDEWDLAINQWMAECHVAVILFSNAALKSSWVKKEAAILTWRKRLDSERFVLIGVLLDGLTAGQVDADPDYKALRATDFQFVRDCWHAGDPAATVACTLRELRKTLPARAGGDTPFDRLRDVIQGILVREAGAETLEAAWDALPAPGRPVWSAASGERFAAALSRYLLRDRRRPLHRLCTVLGRIQPVIREERAHELLRHVRSLWVDAESAGLLCDARANAQPSGVGLGSGYFARFTARHYIERAWPMNSEVVVIKVNGQESDLNGIRRTIVARFDYGSLDEAEAEGFHAHFIERCRQVPILLIYPPGVSLPDAALIGQIRAAYPNLVIFVGLAAGVPAAVPGLRLLPRLDPELEKGQSRERRDAQVFLENLYRHADDAI